jgi:hypothetical protein
MRVCAWPTNEFDVKKMKHVSGVPSLKEEPLVR